MEIFVFGSNEAGRHGAGSAAHARLHHGVRMGQPEGLQGQSYGIPTKDKDLKPLSVIQIARYLHRFFLFAELAPNWTFRCVAIGCGLAGHKPEEIAPYFCEAPKNVMLPKEFIEVLGQKQ